MLVPGRVRLRVFSVRPSQGCRSIWMDDRLMAEVQRVESQEGQEQGELLQVAQVLAPTTET